MTALFITVFVDQWRETKNHIPALSGIIVTLACLLVFGKDNFLIPAMVLIVVVLALGKKFIDSGDGDKESEKYLMEEEDMMP